MEVCKCSGWKTRSRAGRWGFALAVSILLCLCDEAGCSGKNDIKVDLSKLTIDQLRSFHTQLGTDESLLVKSYKQLRVASNAFYDSRQAIKSVTSPPWPTPRIPLPSWGGQVSTPLTYPYFAGRSSQRLSGIPCFCPSPRTSTSRAPSPRLTGCWSTSAPVTLSRRIPPLQRTTSAERCAF